MTSSVLMMDEDSSRRRSAAIYSATILVSLAGHWLLVGGLSTAAHNAPRKPRISEVAVVRSVVEVPPEPPPPTPQPIQEKTKRPPPPKDMTLQTPPPEQTPPPNTNEPPAAEPAKPVFGISMSSTVSGNSGFSMRVGNTTMKDPDKERVAPEDVKPYAAPKEKYVPVYSLSQPPKPTGECREPYPQAARDAKVQGRIKLDVEIRTDGTVGEVTPLNTLGYGLEDTAVRALKKCKFKPGNDGTQNVATRITYFYTFSYEQE